MAFLVANTGIDFVSLDLNWFCRNLETSVLFDNDPKTNPYSQTYGMLASDGFDSLVFSMSGSGFTLGDNGQPVSGRINAMGESYGRSNLWTLGDIDIDAPQFVAAMHTGDGADELALIGAALAGDDRIILSDWDDNVSGFSGNDLIRGHDGWDYLDGGAGNDTIYGDQGSDVVFGGAGKDLLIGGTDADVFLFTELSDSRKGRSHDVIEDFAKGDLIDLSLLDADTAMESDQSFNFTGRHGFTGQAGELRFAKGMLTADCDGDGQADFALQIDFTRKLAADDFVL